MLRQMYQIVWICLKSRVSECHFDLMGNQGCLKMASAVKQSGDPIAAQTQLSVVSAAGMYQSPGEEKTGHSPKSVHTYIWSRDVRYLTQLTRTVGALDGGSPISHVEFKKWKCPLSLFLQYPCRL